MLEQSQGHRAASRESTKSLESSKGMVKSVLSQIKKILASFQWHLSASGTVTLGSLGKQVAKSQCLLK